MPCKTKPAPKVQTNPKNPPKPPKGGAPKKKGV